jgi:hypothetical protein
MTVDKPPCLIRIAQVVTTIGAVDLVGEPKGQSLAEEFL